jgi:hypothetical protein
MKVPASLKLFFVFSVFIGGILIGAMLRGCGKQKPCPEIQKSKSTVSKKTTVDTIAKPKKETIAPKPIREEQTGYVPYFVTAADFFDIDTSILDFDSAQWVRKELYDALVKEYSTKRYYQDSTIYTEGRVDQSAVVQGNKLTSWSVQPTFYEKTTTITETKTITTQSPKRRQLYFNLGGQYLIKDTTMGVIAGLAWKDKKDRVFTVNGIADTRGNYGAQATASFLISFKKNKK